jgi:hypothetical protein
LLVARAAHLNWGQIQLTYFPAKSPNACRKRHERLLERTRADNWDDALKLQHLGKEYMAMRKEIWSCLAARTGVKWNVVEAKVGAGRPIANRGLTVSLVHVEWPQEPSERRPCCCEKGASGV